MQKTGGGARKGAFSCNPDHWQNREAATQQGCNGSRDLQAEGDVGAQISLILCILCFLTCEQVQLELIRYHWVVNL